MKKYEEEKRKVIPFVREFNWISIEDLENIMEWQQDNEYLTEKGKAFRQWVWELFILKPKIKITN